MALTTRASAASCCGIAAAGGHRQPSERAGNPPGGSAVPRAMEASQPPLQHPQKPAVATLAPEEPAAAAACGKAAAAGDAEPGAGATAVAAHHLKKRSEMARVDSVGLVSNDSLNEEEVRLLRLAAWVLVPPLYMGVLCACECLLKRCVGCAVASGCASHCTAFSSCHALRAPWLAAMPSCQGTCAVPTKQPYTLRLANQHCH